jgi:hypothetical protein
MEEIKTYPEMNRSIKKLLKLEGSNVSLYALARIEELENEVEKLKQVNLIASNTIIKLTKPEVNNG